MPENNLESILKSEEANPDQNKSASSDSLEGRVESKEKKGSASKSFFWNSLGIGLGYAASGLLFGSPMSALYMAGAFGIGHLIEKARNKEKFSFSEFMKDLSTGALLAPLGLFIYSAVDSIPNQSFLGKAARWAYFAGPLAGLYIYLNRGFLYFRDKVGLKNTVKSLFNLKIFEHIYDAHVKDIIPNWYKGMKTAIKNFGPIWAYTLNFVPSPAVRLIIGNVNDVIYRILVSGKKVKDTVIWTSMYQAAKKAGQGIAKPIKKVFYDAPKKLFTPSYTPAYST